MAILTCPSCSKKLSVPQANQANQLLRCPSCKNCFRTGPAAVPSPQGTKKETTPAGITARPLQGQIKPTEASRTAIVASVPNSTNLFQSVLRNGHAKWLIALLISIPLLLIAILFLGVWLLVASLRTAPLQSQNTAPPVVQNQPKEKPNKKPPQPVVGASGQLTADVLQKVKAATVYIRVDLPEGESASGSGFFAIQDDLVLTNAHVLGMLDAQRKPPDRVQVILHSGQKNEETLPAKIVSVDRVTDLAVLRVKGPKKSVPGTLPVRKAEDLRETQRVWVVGYPFGEQLGKAVTVSNSSVSSFRRDPDGELEKIQVNGGMHPGNSGGPLVDGNGHVVGVAVSGIKATQINFAIPSERIHYLLNGQITNVDLGRVTQKQGRLAVPVQVESLDPLQAILKIEVRWWLGPKADPHAVSVPANRHSVALAYQAKEARGQGELLLPAALPTDHVLWYQTVFTNRSGKIDTTKTAFQQIDAPPMRQPVVLKHQFPQKPFPATLKVTSIFKSGELGSQTPSIKRFDVDARLAVSVAAANSGNARSLRISLAHLNIFQSENTHEIPAKGPIRALLRMRASFGFTGAMSDHGDLVQIEPAVPLASRRFGYEEYMTAFGKEFDDYLQLTQVSLPNAILQPMQLWRGSRTLVLKAGEMPLKRPLDMTYTYLGIRHEDKRRLAIIQIDGKLRDRLLNGVPMKAKVTGVAAVDLTAGHLVRGRVKVDTMVESFNPLSVTAAARGTLEVAYGRGDDCAPALPDYHPLWGAWRIIHDEVNGTKRPLPRSERWRTFDKDGMKYMDPQQRVYDIMHFWLRPDIGPYAIDIEYNDDKLGNLQILPGIFNIQGDRLKICTGLMGMARPKDFASFPNSGRVFHMFDRVKNYKPKPPRKVVVLKPNKPKDPVNENPALVLTPDVPDRIPAIKPVKLLPKNRLQAIYDFPAGGRVKRLVFAPDGRRVLAIADRDIQLWDVETGKKLRAFQGHRGPISDVAWSADGKHFLSAGRDKTLRWWNAQTGEEVRTLQGHLQGVLSVALSPTGRYAASGGLDGALRFWDMATGEQLRRLKTAQRDVTGVAFSPDGRYLLSASGENSTGQLSLWDIKTGRLEKTYACGGYPRCAAFSPDGKTLFTIFGYKISAFDRETGRTVQTYPGAMSIRVHITPDGQYVCAACIRDGLRIWENQKSTPILELGRGDMQVRAATISADGRRFLITDSEKFYLWGLKEDPLFAKKAKTRADQPSVVYQFPGHPGGTATMTISGDNTLVVTGGGKKDPSLRLWFGSTGKELRKFTIPKGVHTKALVLSPDAKTLYSAGGGRVRKQGRIVELTDMNIHIWDTQTGRETKQLPGHMGLITALAISPNGRWLLSGGYDGTRLWDLSTGKEVQLFKTARQGVSSACFSPDGQLAAVASGRRVHIIDVPNKREKFALPANGFVQFTSDGKRLYSMGGTNFQVWDVQLGTELRKSPVELVYAGNFSRDGRYALAKNSNSKWSLYDMKSGQKIYTTPFGGEHVLTPDGRHVLVRRVTDVTLYSLPAQGLKGD